MNSPVLQVMMLAVVLFSLLQVMIRQLGIMPTLLISAMLGWIAVLAHLLKNRPAIAERLYGNPLGKYSIDGLCRVTQLPKPIHTGKNVPLPFDASRLARQIKSEVYGHDIVVDGLLEQVRRGVQLSERGLNNGPLAVALLAGPNGIGKRTLALALGRAVFPDAEAKAVDLRGCVQGIEDYDAEVTAATAGRRCKTLVLEHLEAAGPAVTMRLRSFLCSLTAEPRGGLLILTATTPTAPSDAGPTWLTELAGLDNELLSVLSNAYVMNDLQPLDRARVVLRLVQREFCQFNVSVDFVAPEFVAQAVADWTGVGGAGGVAATVNRRIRTPLQRALDHNLQRCSILEVRE